MMSMTELDDPLPSPMSQNATYLVNCGGRSTSLLLGSRRIGHHSDTRPSRASSTHRIDRRRIPLMRPAEVVTLKATDPQWVGGVSEPEARMRANTGLSKNMLPLLR